MTARDDDRNGARRPLSSSVGYLFIATLTLVIAGGIVATSAEPPLPHFASPGVALPTSTVTRAQTLLDQPGNRVISVEEQSVATLAGYLLALGSTDDDGWRIDFAETGPVGPIAVERAVIGVYTHGGSVERIGPLSIAGSGAHPELDSDASLEERIAAMVGVIEVSGHVDGRVARVPTDNAATVQALAESLGLRPRAIEFDEVTEFVLDRLEDRSTVASWNYACLDRVPLVGGRDCDGAQHRLAFVDSAVGLPVDRSTDGDSVGRSIVDWRVATTGPLDRRDAHWLTAEQGAVRWTNGEAQQYRDDAVTRTDDGLVITVRPHPEARVDRAPFDSGMIVSEETFGWGRIEVDVRLPTGAGLWPAIWLLDSEACSAPGMCEGYSTPKYHEIDLLETSGGTEVATSVHWFDERIRSLSTTTELGVIGDDEVHTIAIDRRPGQLVWRLDGVEIDRVEGPATAASGPHRASPMRLIVNVAVGGTFAGDRLLGPTSPWWGSSTVPDRYPDLGWVTASMTVLDARFIPLDDLVLG